MEKYTVDDGRITNPGKFEGEMYYTPYYYELSLDGSADVDIYEEVYGYETCTGAIFNLTEEDYNKFPELVGYTKLELSFWDNGFVSCGLS